MLIGAHRERLRPSCPSKHNSETFVTIARDSWIQLWDRLRIRYTAAAEAKLTSWLSLSRV